MIEKLTTWEEFTDWIRKLFCRHVWSRHVWNGGIIDMNGNEYFQCQKCSKLRWSKGWKK
jgi:hypothetical protein